MDNNSSTKVFIMTKFPRRQQKPGDQTYLCYEDTTPPWDKEELFCVKDESQRNWFCHPFDIELSRETLQTLANQVKEDYSPRTEEALRRRLHNPLVVQIVICRAETLDELRDLLGKLQRPSRESA